MRVACLYDIHGNLPALDAVLVEVAREEFTHAVIGGDVFWGPWPAESLARVRSLGAEVLFVRGNCDRETFARDPSDRFAAVNAWVAGRLSGADEAFVGGWPATVELAVDGVGRTCFCHATIGSDTEIVTPRSPRPALTAALAGTDAEVVVCGHTHVQFDLDVGGTRLVNAGSVGWGYEGRPGAYWLELGPSIRHRRTEYDYEAAAAALAEVAWPGPLGPGDLLAPPSPDEAIAAFEARRARASP